MRRVDGIGWHFIPFACVLSCVLPSCSSHESTPILERTGKATQSVVSGRHHGGTDGFVFLPPIAPPPAVHVSLVADLPLTVRVEELNADGTAVRTLATFTKNGGPNSEHLRIHYQNQPCDADDNDGDSDVSGYYYVRWFVDNAKLPPSANYRIRVLVPGEGGQMQQLGETDVYVPRRLREYGGIGAADFAPLVSGTPLRIKFRVDWRAVDRDHDGVYNWLDNCVSTPNPDQQDTLKDGVGDACRCAHVSCAPLNACQLPGFCDQRTGLCTNLAAPEGAVCPVLHGRGTCSQGACLVQACFPGHSDCNGDPSDGCEISIRTIANCGGCGNVCEEGPYSRALCRLGQCKLVCSTGHADCDGNAANGCEQEVGIDPNNCGRCGRVCRNHEGCFGGACTAELCAEPYADCNGSHADGCEVDLAVDPNHCGSCDTICNLPNATSTCSAGVCVVAQCNVGYADCNGVAADGCETPTTDDVGNCGGCGISCVSPHATASSCVDGVCVVTCEAGYGACGGTADVCGTNLSSDTNHCGSCDNQCSTPASNSYPACRSGICAIDRCLSTVWSNDCKCYAPASLADCNGSVQDGCEVNLSSDPSNCGACGTGCPTRANSAPICSGGKCGLACDSGYADCDGNQENGCEIYLQDTCGVCACSLANANSECTNGSCTYSVCNPGYADCDGIVANGCEVALATDANHCGGCGVVCSQGTVCSDSTCVPGCRIGSMFYAPGAGDSLFCGSCQTDVSTTALTPPTPNNCKCDGTPSCIDCSEPGCAYHSPHECLNHGTCGCYPAYHSCVGWSPDDCLNHPGCFLLNANVTWGY